MLMPRGRIPHPVPFNAYFGIGASALTMMYPDS